MAALSAGLGGCGAAVHEQTTAARADVASADAVATRSAASEAVGALNALAAERYEGDATQVIGSGTADEVAATVRQALGAGYFVRADTAASFWGGKRPDHACLILVKPVGARMGSCT